MRSVLSISKTFGQVAVTVLESEETVSYSGALNGKTKVQNPILLSRYMEHSEMILNSVVLVLYI